MLVDQAPEGLILTFCKYLPCWAVHQLHRRSY